MRVYLGIAEESSLNWLKYFVCLSIIGNTYLPLIPCSSRMMDVQMSMAERAIELLKLPQDQPCYVLDVG